ncbi:hypothetical protein Gorai_007302, partial [Gossypium raimondii]|nr:hypothetical protein [Gossypium raimondii]
YLRDTIVVVSAGHKLASFQFLILTTISLQLDHLSGSLKHLRSWLVSNIGSSANWRFNIPLWSSIFGMMCWKLWKSRNGFIFNGAKLPTVLPITLFSLVWPGLGVMVLIQGVMSMVEKAAGGGLLRDENGTWILGYGRCFGERSVVQAEAWATYNGLRIAWEHGYKKVQVESDSLDMVNMVLHGSSDGFLLPIVADMRSLCLRDWTMVVQHISKEVNLIADCLV